MKVNKLRVFVFCPRKDCDNRLFQLAYSFWKKLWLETYRELVGLDKINSDSFLSSYRVVCVFNDIEVVAIGLIHNFDFSNPLQKELSYFNAFSDKSLDSIFSKYKRISSIDNIAISPNYRKKGIVQLLFHEIYKIFIETSSDILVAYTRNNRSINKVAYDLGASSLDKNILNHAVKTDIIFFDRNVKNKGENNGRKKAS